MSRTRRDFLLGSTYVGAGLAMTGAISPLQLCCSAEPVQLAAYLTGMRIAATPATPYRAYRSEVVKSPDVTTWAQIDLGKSLSIAGIQLFPASERGLLGEGFPLRFRIDASDDASFSAPINIADFTHDDFPDPADRITQYVAHGVHARYVRLTATRLRALRFPVQVETCAVECVPATVSYKDSPDFTLTVAKITVLSGGRDVAVGCNVTVDAEHGNTELAGQLTRPAREDGEQIRYDQPQLVTDASTWKPVQYRAEPPKTGVTLHDGLFRAAMQNNIEYLRTPSPQKNSCADFTSGPASYRPLSLPAHRSSGEKLLPVPTPAVS